MLLEVPGKEAIEGMANLKFCVWLQSNRTPVLWFIDIMQPRCPVMVDVVCTTVWTDLAEPLEVMNKDIYYDS